MGGVSPVGSRRYQFTETARAAALLGGAVVLAGCLPTSGFYSAEGLLLVAVGTALAAWAVARPGDLIGLDTGLWPRRGLRAVGPALLLWTTSGPTTTCQPLSAAWPLWLAAVVGLLPAVLAAREDEPLTRALAVGLLLWAPGAALWQTHLMYVDRPAAETVVGLAWWLAVGLGLVGLLPLPATPLVRRAWLGAALSLGLLVRAGALVASPDPVIDVYAWLVQAPRALASGRNPYAMRLASPYDTPRARHYGSNTPADDDPPTYPPGIILHALPAAAGVDPRWVLVAAWFALTGLTLAAGRGAAHPAVGLLLLLPTVTFTAEQAWFDILLAVWFTAGLWWPPGRGGLAWGLALTVKQTGVFLLPAMIAARYAERRRWTALAATVAAVVGPFVLWSPSDFWHDVVAGHLGTSVRLDALCLPVWWHLNLGWDLPAEPLLLLVVAVASLVAWRARTSRPGTAVAAAVGLLVFNLLNRRAMLNYYEVAVALLVVGAVLPEHETDASAS